VNDTDTAGLVLGIGLAYRVRERFQDYR